MNKKLVESANSFMGRDSYEQRKMDEMELDVDDLKLGGEEEEEEVVSLDVDPELGDELEGDLEGEEEIPMLTVDLAIKAIQLALNGEVETAEEALELVRAEEGEGEEEIELGGEEGEELEGLGDELGTDELETESSCEDKEDVVEEEVEEVDESSDEEVVEEEEEAPAEEEQYGESHSMFLKYSAQYL